MTQNDHYFVTIPENQQTLLLLLQVPSPFRRLAIIKAILIFETAALNSSLLLQPNHSLRFFSHELRLLPTDLFPSIFPSIISCNIRYFSPLMTCLIYCNYLALIVVITSLPYVIHTSHHFHVGYSVYP